MRETMQFQLSDTFSNHLIKYDDIRKKTIKSNSRKPSKKSEYPLGLPPLDKLIPYDVLPYGTKRKEEIIKTISRTSPEHRYTHMSYPKVTDKYPQIGKEDHLFKETDRRVTWDGHRVKRHVLIYHYEGMWTCLWIPHTNKYVYGYSFAFKDNKSNQIKFESHPSRDYSPDRKVFCRKNNGKYMTRMDQDGKNSNPNWFDGWSWNECETIKLHKTAWRYKTVYVTKEMIKNGHYQDPTCGMFFGRPIGDGNREKDQYISRYLEHFQGILKKSIPQWEEEYRNRRGYWANRGAYRSKDNKMFDRLVRNSIGSVMKDKFMTEQKNWKYCADDYNSMVAAGNKDLIFKDTDKWDVHKLKDLLFRLNHKQCRTLYERRHNIGHVLWKEKGWIDQPFFRRLLHDAMESTETRLRHSQDQTKSFVVVEIKKLDHLIKWIECVLDVWPDTPVDYFKNYQEALENVCTPWLSRNYSNEETNESLMMTRHYLSRMPVKTFFEYVKKTYEQASRDTRRNYQLENSDELYGRGDRGRFYNTESETMRFVMHEFDDTINMLKDVMLRFKREGRMEKDLPSPRRWRMTEFHDHINAEQWKCRTEKEKLPQDLFPKPLHIKAKDIVSNLDTWFDVERDSTFCFFQPQDTHQLAEWGRAARNCVGSTSYGKGIKKKEHFIVLIMINKIPRYTVQLRLSDQILRIDVGSGIKDIANKELSREEKEFVELAFNHAFNLRTKQLEESK